MQLSEKYRPKTIKEVVGHDIVKSTLQSWLARDDYPHTLFYGPKGSGKTSLAHAFVNEWYGDTKRGNFLEQNSSDERGIDVVRTRIKDFTRRGATGGHRYRCIFLDEIDGLTKDAQRALNRTLELAEGTCRFFASCNHPEKLIPALLSRFVRFYMGPLMKMQIMDHLVTISKIENEGEINDETSAICLIIAKTSNGDLRQAVEMLDAIPKDFTPEQVESLFPRPTDEHVSEVLAQIIEGTKVNLWKVKDHPSDFLEKLFASFETHEHPLRPQILETIAEFAWRVTQPCNSYMQLYACCHRLQQILGVG